MNSSDFTAYRSRLLSKKMPNNVDCLVWLQSNWRTLAGTGQIVQWHEEHPQACIVIFGHDDGNVDVENGQMMRGGAPSILQMYKVLQEVPLSEEFSREHVYVRPFCDNTAKQAKAFAQFVGAHEVKSALVLAPDFHLPRAALTFEDEGVGIELTWRSVVGTVSDWDDGVEQMKIGLYGLVKV
jgi:hypothetical protein